GRGGACRAGSARGWPAGPQTCSVVAAVPDSRQAPAARSRASARSAGNSSWGVRPATAAGSSPKARAAAGLNDSATSRRGDWTSKKARPSLVRSYSSSRADAALILTYSTRARLGEPARGERGRGVTGGKTLPGRQRSRAPRRVVVAPEGGNQPS